MIFRINSKRDKRPGELLECWEAQHKDIGYLYLRQAKERYMVKIEWITSTNNNSELCTIMVNTE